MFYILRFLKIKNLAPDNLRHIRLLPEVILLALLKQFEDLRFCLPDVLFYFLCGEGLIISDETDHILAAGNEVHMVQHEYKVINL